MSTKTRTRKSKDGYSIFVQVTPQFEKIWSDLKEYVMPASDAELFRTIVKEYYKNLFGEEKLKFAMIVKEDVNNG